MSDFESESETELLVLKDRRRYTYDNEYFNPRNRRLSGTKSMGSLLKCCG